MGFDEWFDNQNIENWTNKKYMFQAYEAGAASRQAEIDELKNRIDETLRTIEPSDEITHSLYRKVYKILKGGN